MLTYSHEISYRFFDAGGGDAVWIRFLGDDKNWHNVLIDGGYGKAYKYTFGPLIKQISAAGERIDLWVITHIDRDHIGSVLGFIQDKKITDKTAMVKEFWFNHAEFNVKTTNGKLAVSDGINFRKYLNDHGLLMKARITTSLALIEYFGLKLHILSPTPEKQQIANDLWFNEEHNRKLGRRASDADHHLSIETLKDQTFSSDTDDINSSSIALLVSYKNVNALLLSDSHPADIVASLTNLGYGSSKPVEVAFMQLAHHGSKANTSPSLLEMIRTDDYIITGNGIHNRHPDKATLVRVLVQENRSDKLLKLHFACDTEELNRIFSVDECSHDRYNFVCNYGGIANGGICLKYLPLTCDL